MISTDMRKGAVVAITREAGDAVALSARLKKMGARVLAMPTIAVRRRPLPPRSAAALSQVSTYDIVLFTSAHAVRFFSEELGRKKSGLHRVRVAAVGPSTAAALRAIGLRPNVIPKRFTVRDLIAALGVVRGKRILFPRSAIATAYAVRALRDRGARVTVVRLYDTVAVNVPISARSALLRAKNAYIVFASPSAVRGLLRSVRGNARRAMLAVAAVCIGPRTAVAVRHAGFREVHVAHSFTTDGLMATLRRLP